MPFRLFSFRYSLSISLLPFTSSPRLLVLASQRFVTSARPCRCDGCLFWEGTPDLGQVSALDPGVSVQFSLAALGVLVQFSLATRGVFAQASLVPPGVLEQFSLQRPGVF